MVCRNRNPIGSADGCRAHAAAEYGMARMKCALKMILYMAVGIPMVVSPVGVNAEILGQSEVGLPATSGDGWYEGLRLLYDDRGLAARFGAAGRRLAEERYSVAKNASMLADIFRKV